MSGVNHSLSYFTMKCCVLCFQAIEYEVGDIVEVLPSQSPIAIDTFIQRCNLNPESFITVCSSFLSQFIVGYPTLYIVCHYAWIDINIV